MWGWGLRTDRVYISLSLNHALPTFYNNNIRHSNVINKYKRAIIVHCMLRCPRGQIQTYCYKLVLYLPGLVMSAEVPRDCLSCHQKAVVSRKRSSTTCSQEHRHPWENCGTYYKQSRKLPYHACHTNFISYQLLPAR